MSRACNRPSPKTTMLRCPHCQANVRPRGGLQVHISRWCRAHSTAISDALEKRRERLQEEVTVQAADHRTPSPEPEDRGQLGPHGEYGDPTPKSPHSDSVTYCHLIKYDLV